MKTKTRHEYSLSVRAIEIKTGRIIGSIVERDDGLLAYGKWDLEKYTNFAAWQLLNTSRQRVSRFAVQNIILPQEYTVQRIAINVPKKEGAGTICIVSGNKIDEILNKILYYWL
ncbi:MAG: hypothetical protein ACREOO_04370 [bacterium]